MQCLRLQLWFYFQIKIQEDGRQLALPAWTGSEATFDIADALKQNYIV